MRWGERTRVEKGREEERGREGGRARQTREKEKRKRVSTEARKLMILSKWPVSMGD